MSKVNIFKCDICLHEVRYDAWHTAPVLLKSEGAGIQFKHEYGEVCKECAAKLMEAISAVIVSRR